MWSWLQLLFVLLSVHGAWQICVRRPQGATGESSAVDENFQVVIDGNPKTYIPGQRYNISLSCDAALKFISFTLVVESEYSNISDSADTIGYFELTDTAETRFSSSCTNMIENTNTNWKISVSVGWVAPAGGCVLIKAAVLQHRAVWFIDDGFLTKRICPEEIDEVNSQTPPVDPCCACDEAKYELIVERKWGRNTHPRDFPVEEWRTQLSELIGASHTQSYRFWNYSGLASRGLKEMAEHGNTRLLELEIKSGDIRTIIKAPGIKHRKNVISTTLANVRVDPQHHVISLVSKIEPSPDWLLGVAGLELCLENCTWISEKVLNLYPWDAGTDAGPSYMSPDQPQIPPDVVRRLTSTSPNDERSPFYDKSGAPMKPIATLYVRRKKLYGRECDSTEIIPLECTTHPWNTWSECTARCGPGTKFRTRAYKDPTLAASFNCQVVLRQNSKCVGEQCGVAEVTLDNGDAAECELTAWSAWTACTRRCGRGTSTRTRDYTNPYEREKCLNDNPVELEQRRDCEGKDCGGRQTQSRHEGDVEDDNENERENENVGADEYGTIGDTDNPVEEDGLNRLSQPEQFRGRQPALSNRRPSSGYFGRQKDFSDDENEQEVPFEDITEQTGVVDDNQKLDEDPYNQRFGNRGMERERERNRYRGNGARYDTYNRPTDDWPDSNVDEGSNFGGYREEYDENGRKAIVVQASDPSNYNVVQQYCFEKPSPWRSRCAHKNLRVQNYWCYDSDDRQCKIFTTDGCDDNKNKFLTLEACEGTCLLPHSNQEQEQAVEEGSDEWGRQFGQSESLVKKPRRKIGRKNRTRKQNEHIVGNIGYYR